MIVGKNPAVISVALVVSEKEWTHVEYTYNVRPPR
jgi:hypothetical protein